jgi:nitrite reductase/ring-hydroxylating ferredoxin subunit
MSDPVRVSVETDTDGEAVRVHDDAGEVTTDEATFSFSIDGAEATDARSGSESEQAIESDGNTDSASPDGDADATQSTEATAAERADPRYVAPVSAVPTDSTLRCEVLQGDRGWEVILRRVGEEVTAWHNSCPHKPEVRLDPGGGAIVDGDEVVCHDHGARFECGDGDGGVCTYGPCRGDALEAVAMTRRDGDVYLTDERFDACRRLE